MSQDGVTVLMPLKNYHPVFLRKALESVMNQSCPYWRLLIIVEKGDFEHFRRLLAIELADSRIEIIPNEEATKRFWMKYATVDERESILIEN